MAAHRCFLWLFLLHIFSIFASVDAIGRSIPLPSTVNAPNLNAISISSDGRYVAFSSTSPKWVFDDTNSGEDIFLWDTQDPLQLVSKMTTTNAGNQAWGTSNAVIFSKDSRYLYFRSDATNFLDSTPSEELNYVSRVWRRDLTQGAVNPIALVSALPNGTATRTQAFLCGTSADGSLAVFQAWNFVYASPEVTYEPSIANRQLFSYLKNMTSGELIPLGLNPAGNESAQSRCGDSQYNTRRPSISSNGKWVTFASDSNNLDAFGRTALSNRSQGIFDAYLRNLELGQTVGLSVGLPVVGNTTLRQCFLPVIAVDANRLAMHCTLGEELANEYRIYVCEFYDDGSTLPTCTPLYAGEGDVNPYHLEVIDISADGRYVFFTSPDKGFLNDSQLATFPASYPSYFMFDTTTNATTWIDRPSSLNVTVGSTNSFAASADMQRLVLATSIDLLGEQLGTYPSVYLVDRQNNTTTRLAQPTCFYSTQAECDKVSWQSFSPAFGASMSERGEAIAWVTADGGLTDLQLPTAPNGAGYVYIRYPEDHLNEVISFNGQPVLAKSGQVSADGVWVVYYTGEETYRYNTITKELILIGTSVLQPESMSVDGRYVAFETSTPHLYPIYNPIDLLSSKTAVLVHDAVTGRYIWPAFDRLANGSFRAWDYVCHKPALSDSGRWLVARCTGLGMVRWDLTDLTKVPELINFTPNGSVSKLLCDVTSITDDGRYVTVKCTDWNKAINDLLPTSYQALSEALVIIDTQAPIGSPARTVLVRPPPFTNDWIVAPFIMSGWIVSKNYTADHQVVVSFGFFKAGADYQQGSTTGCKYYLSTNETVCEEGPGLAVTTFQISLDGNYELASSVSYDVVFYDMNGVADIFLRDHTIDSKYTLVSAHENYFAETLSFPCPGSRPTPRFLCEDGLWVLSDPNTVIVRTPVVVGDTAIAVVGSPIIVSTIVSVNCSGQLILAPSGSIFTQSGIDACGQLNLTLGVATGSLLSTAGCLNLNSATFNINASSIDLTQLVAGQTLSIPLATFSNSCSTLGSYDARITPGQTGSDCKVVTSQVSQSLNQLFVVFQIDESKCASTPSEESASLLAVYIAVPIVAVLVVVTVILVIAVPGLRQRMLPIRDYHTRSRANKRAENNTFQLQDTSSVEMKPF